MACESHSAVGKIGSAYFVGLVIGCLFIPRLADLYGRKWFIIICNILVIPTLMCFLFMESINTLTFCFFVLGILFTGHTLVNFLWGMEFIVKRLRVKVYALITGNSRVLIIFAVIYFRYISQSWVYWILSVILVQICLVFCYFWFPESPDFYYAKGRYEESKLILLDIARFNGVEMTSDQLDF